MFRTDDGAAPRTIPRREADALVSAALLEATQQAAAASTELLAILRGGGLVNGILEATTRNLDDDGELHFSWRVPAGSAAITNHSDTDMWVTNAPTSSRRGRGATLIPAHTAATVYLASTDLTIAGAAGALVGVVVFTGTVQPAWHGGGGTGSGSGGSSSSSTGALSSVADSATSVLLLAANASRKGGTVYNDSTVALHLALAATASLTAYTVKIPPDGYYELPDYTGPVAGIWASDAAGSARVTELS